ncbi:hypothetical protein Micbo1qcDRAFT_56374 [Microdochium bolleyi]|uniref:Uncharacterized protein n=1 Tax=Microdochium bolleyi TaxID=196109 RepID=A0A136IJU9_9PEZI|nr:hypothetical protein Micbo1qcDRAFT_56374 [Microdochium bolleyi]
MQTILGGFFPQDSGTWTSHGGGLLLPNISHFHQRQEPVPAAHLKDDILNQNSDHVAKTGTALSHANHSRRPEFDSQAGYFLGPSLRPLVARLPAAPAVHARGPYVCAGVRCGSETSGAAQVCPTWLWVSKFLAGRYSTWVIGMKSMVRAGLHQNG